MAASCNAAGSGTRAVFRASRQSRMTGPCVISNAPPVASASSCDAGEDGEQILADRHRATDRGPGDSVQLAVGPVVREDGVEVADAIEGGAERVLAACSPGA